MRAAVLLHVILVAAIATGCATAMEVSVDETADFSGVRTWAWLPGGRNVDAVPGEAQPLDALTSRLVEAELRRRGLARVAGGADLLVGYELQVDRHLVAVNETSAAEFLSSHHYSHSYVVQSTEARMDVYDHGYLRLVVTDGTRERRLWQGELWARRRGDFARHLPEAVSRLLGDFPAEPPPAAAAPLH